MDRQRVLVIEYDVGQRCAYPSPRVTFLQQSNTLTRAGGADPSRNGSEAWGADDRAPHGEYTATRDAAASLLTLANDRESFFYSRRR